jgi:hypothetical protein
MIQFVAQDGRRKSVRLGKVTAKLAESIKIRIETIQAAKITGHPLDSETAQWLAGLDPELAEKLANVGLIPQASSSSLGAFLDDYIGERRDVKPSTKITYNNTRRNLLEFFDYSSPLRDITAGDADR